MNRYIKRFAGEFTAKDFRTWNATVLAAVALAAAGPNSSRAQREQTVRSAVKTVAAYLGNTPAVCRASYIDPRVIDSFYAGVTIAATIDDIPSTGPNLANVNTRKHIENAVLELLAQRSSANRQVA